jgi:hypothetical protein
MTGAGKSTKETRMRNLGKKCNEAFSMGIKAFYRGYTKSPFNATTLMHKEWERGFNTSYMKHRKRILGYEVK